MSRRRKRYYQKNIANAKKMPLSSLQARVTKWQNEIDALSKLKTGLSQEAEGYQILEKKKVDALSTRQFYKKEFSLKNV